jgi:hypothetical protein
MLARITLEKLSCICRRMRVLLGLSELATFCVHMSIRAYRRSQQQQA